MRKKLVSELLGQAAMGVSRIIGRMWKAVQETKEIRKAPVMKNVLGGVDHG